MQTSLALPSYSSQVNMSLSPSHLLVKQHMTQKSVHHRIKPAASTIIISTICTASRKWGWGWVGGDDIEFIFSFAFFDIFIFIFVLYFFYSFYVHFLSISNLFYCTPDFHCDVDYHYFAIPLSFLTVFP